MLAHASERLSALVYTIRMTVCTRFHVPHETTTQYLEVLLATAKGDSEAAIDAMRRHFEVLATAIAEERTNRLPKLFCLTLRSCLRLPSSLSRRDGAALVPLCAADEVLVCW